MPEIDIKELTREAESGNGCSIKEKLAEIPFEDSLKALKAIQEQNKVNRDTDASLPRVFMVVNGGHTGAIARLDKKDTSWSLPDELTADRIDFTYDTMAKRSQTCADSH